MATKKAAKKVAPKDEAGTDEVKKTSKAKKAPSEASVFDKEGGYVRTYSVADHGENYLALAKQYAKKISGTVEEGSYEAEAEEEESQ